MTNGMDNGNNNQPPFEKPDFFESSSVKLGWKRHYFLTALAIVILITITTVALFSESWEKTDTPVKDAVGWDSLRIDGNRNGNFVLFDHESHKVIAGKGEAGCKVCHHLSRPNDGPSSCNECHKYMEKTSSIFNHTYHAEINQEKTCRECHTNDNSQENGIKPCSICHKDYYNKIGYYLKVRGYKSAMHTKCMGCHEKEDEKSGVQMLSDCGVCHTK